MEQFPVLNFQDFISGDLTTDSLKVAAVFGKRHDNVLENVRKVMAQIPEEDRALNFKETVEYRENPSGGAMIPSPAYRISRDGFVLLVMGFSGKKAFQFKLAYIKAFNEMESFIKNQKYGLQCRYFELQLEHKGKKAKASFHGRGLNEWKGEKPVLETAMKAIEEQISPQLPFPQTVQ